MLSFPCSRPSKLITAECRRCYTSSPGPLAQSRVASSGPIEEFGDELRGLSRFLDHREVSGIFDGGEPRSSDLPRGLLRRLPREMDVVPAGQDGRGGADSWEGRAHGGVAAPQG